jgi:hypothetical protein
MNMIDHAPDAGDEPVRDAVAGAIYSLMHALRAAGIDDVCFALVVVRPSTDARIASNLDPEDAVTMMRAVCDNTTPNDDRRRIVVGH